jgi:hypothetical protein
MDLGTGWGEQGVVVLVKSSELVRFLARASHWGPRRQREPFSLDNAVESRAPSCSRRSRSTPPPENVCLSLRGFPRRFRCVRRRRGQTRGCGCRYEHGREHPREWPHLVRFFWSQKVSLASTLPGRRSAVWSPLVLVMLL